jgi:hypothetical protein
MTDKQPPSPAVLDRDQVWQSLCVRRAAEQTSVTKAINEVDRTHRTATA